MFIVVLLTNIARTRRPVVQFEAGTNPPRPSQQEQPPALKRRISIRKTPVLPPREEDLPVVEDKGKGGIEEESSKEKNIIQLVTIELKVKRIINNKRN